MRGLQRNRRAHSGSSRLSVVWLESGWIDFGGLRLADFGLNPKPKALNSNLHSEERQSFRVESGF